MNSNDSGFQDPPVSTEIGTKYVSWQVCCTARFCLLLPCLLPLLRYLLSQQDEMQHILYLLSYNIRYLSSTYLHIVIFL